MDSFDPMNQYFDGQDEFFSATFSQFQHGAFSGSSEQTEPSSVNDGIDGQYRLTGFSPYDSSPGHIDSAIFGSFIADITNAFINNSDLLMVHEAYD